MNDDDGSGSSEREFSSGVYCRREWLEAVANISIGTPSGSSDLKTRFIMTWAIQLYALAAQLLETMIK